jgi:predicted double-glycine peptidase
MNRLVFADMTALALLALCSMLLPRMLGDRQQHRRRTRHIMLSLLFVASVPMLTMVLCTCVPSIPLRWFDPAWYAVIEREYWQPCAVLLFATAAVQVTPRNRRAVFLMACATCGYVIIMQRWRLATPEAYAFERTMNNGVCMQSSGYTCGAASMVTLLHQHGIEATEGEMAQLSGTIPDRGVTDMQAARALQRKLEALGRLERVRFVIVRDHDPESVPTPYIASIDYSFWFNHMICVLEVHDDRVIVGDPLVGLQVLAPDDFREQWLGVAIVIEGLDAADASRREEQTVRN